MKRKIALACAVLAVISMGLPTFEYGATEMGFDPGEPDPNLYQSIVSLGRPFAWIEIVRDRRESGGRDEIRLGVYPWNLLIHLGMLLIPFGIDPGFWKWKRSRSQP